MKDRPPSVRLVKNEIGRGAANALRAGFQAATGDVIVTTMADLCDPPEVIPLMAEKMRKDGCAMGGKSCAETGMARGGYLEANGRPPDAGIRNNHSRNECPEAA